MSRSPTPAFSVRRWPLGRSGDKPNRSAHLERSHKSDCPNASGYNKYLGTYKTAYTFGGDSSSATVRTKSTADIKKPTESVYDAPLPLEFSEIFDGTVPRLVNNFHAYIHISTVDR